MSQPAFTPEQLNILEQCLAAVQSGRRSITQCLAQYPDEAAWLKPELQAAVLASRLAAPAMPQAKVDALEARLMKRFEQKQGHSGNKILRFPGFFAGKAAAVLVLVLLMGLAGTGTVAASAQAKPDDVLYSVKRAWEEFIVVLATLIGQAEDVWLHLSQERAEDVMYLLEKNALSADALEALRDAVERAILLADNDTETQLVSFMQNTGLMLAAKTPDAALAGDFETITLLLTPRYDDNGRLTLVNTLPEDTAIPVVQTATPVASPTMTATLPPTETPFPTATATNTAMPTRTPRIPATATKTPVIPGETPTITPTDVPLSPTATWTDLPLPDGIIRGTPVPDTNSQSPPDSRPATATPQDGQPIFLRETERAVFATQTAIAADNFGTPEP